MPNFLEIELTSKSAEGNWTWRAKGAMKPKGHVAGDLVPVGANVGSIFKAELEHLLDGIYVKSLTPLAEKKPPSNVIEIFGSAKKEPSINVQKKGRKTSPRSKPKVKREKSFEKYPEKHPKSARPQSSGTQRPWRLYVGNEHKNALIESLALHEKPIAERLILGGIPAVRQAIAKQNENARRNNEPEVIEDKILSIAEELFPKIKSALWHDKLDAVFNNKNKVTPGDIRSVIAGAVITNKDDEQKVEELKTLLNERIEHMRQGWTSEILEAIKNNDALAALSKSAKAPDPSLRISAELAGSIADFVGNRLVEISDPQEWLELIKTAVNSPVRSLIKVSVVPDAVKSEAIKLAGSIPSITHVLGIKIPPPPVRLSRPGDYRNKVPKDRPAKVVLKDETPNDPVELQNTDTTNIT
jgi:hypothetical protein